MHWRMTLDKRNWIFKSGIFWKMCRSRGVQTCNSIRRQYAGTDGPRLEIRGWEQDPKGRVLKHMSSIFKLDGPRQVYRVRSLYHAHWDHILGLSNSYLRAVFERCFRSASREYCPFARAPLYLLVPKKYSVYMFRTVDSRTEFAQNHWSVPRFGSRSLVLYEL